MDDRNPRRVKHRTSSAVARCFDLRNWKIQGPSTTRPPPTSSFTFHRTSTECHENDSPVGTMHRNGLLNWVITYSQ